jgi:anhydro-N-acetylmuramic acid kinase
MLYIGLMSGTSMDGIDAVLVDFSQFEEKKWRLPSAKSHSFALDLRAELFALNRPGDNELHRAATAAAQLSRACAKLVNALLAEAGLRAADVCAIGAHGQTVRHRPDITPDVPEPYTVQLINGALLAELTGIDVVCDFRSRDLAAGGQGAPLVPAFHRAVFSGVDAHGAVINIGGIGNISLLDEQAQVAGFDTGPGNVLMDLWCAQHLGQAYDANGNWAASGSVHHGLLEHLMADAYFARQPPKSTGRDLFHAAWLAQRLTGFESVPAADVQATLCELTARSVRFATSLYAADAKRVLICGGGAKNAHLMRRLQLLHPNAHVQATDAFGLPSQDVEAAAFAWLAMRCVQRDNGNLPAATGAKGPRVLGAIYPA